MASSGPFCFQVLEDDVSVVLKALEKLEFFVIAALMLCMVVLYATGIAVREFAPAWSSNVAFVDEATRYLMVWMVFVGLGLALARGRHIAMDVFREKLGDHAASYLRKLIDLIGLGFCLYIAWIGFDIAQRVAGTGQTSPTLGISAGILYASLPAGFALLALRYALSLLGLIDRWNARDDDAATMEAN